MKLQELHEAITRPKKVKLTTLPLTDTLRDILKTRCSKNLAQMATLAAPLLYRGMHIENKEENGGVSHYFVSPGRTKPRTSRTTSNVILSWTTISPAWRDVPNRSLSTSCALAMEDALVFGKMYLIIPFDDVTSYAWTKKDFNFCKVNKRTLLDINLTLYETYKKLRNMFIYGVAPKTLQQYDDDPIFNQSIKASWSLEQIERLSEILDATNNWLREHDDPNHKDVKEQIDILYKSTNGKSLLRFLNEDITPKKLGVQMFNSVNGALKALHTDLESEIWFTGGYVALDPLGKFLDRHLEFMEYLNDEVNGSNS
jgi:hypothetical protein